MFTPPIFKHLYIPPQFQIPRNNPGTVVGHGGSTEGAVEFRIGDFYRKLF